MNRTQPVILTFLILLCCLINLRLAANEISNNASYLLDSSPYILVDEIIPDTICAGTCKIIGGTEYCETGSYTVTEDNGDSYLLELVVLEKEIQYATTDICQGTLYLGEEKNQLGKQIISYNTENAVGCDMTVVVSLEVHAAKSNTIQRTIKYGECIDFGTNTFCQSGEYTLNYGTVYGCDSTVQILLTVEDLISDTIFQEVCTGETFTIQDTTLSQSGLYRLWGENAQGRATLTVVDFRVRSEIITILQESSCEGQPYMGNGATLTESGSYEYLYRAANGCDSLVQLELSVGSVTRTEISQTIPIGESIVVGRNNVSLEGEYEFVYQSVAGCDSIVYLQLSFDNNGTTSGSTTGGGSTTGDGGGTTTGDGGGTTGDMEDPSNPGGGTTGDTGGTTGDGGGTTTGGGDENPNSMPCDEPVIQEFRCAENAPYKYGDNTFWEGGTFNLKVDAADGCLIEEITLNLFIESSRTETVQTTICEGESYTADGIIFREAIDTTLNLQSVSGCDSTLHLELSIATPKDTLIEKTICIGDPFTIGGRFIKASGMYEELYQTTDGCDSLVRIDLTVDGFEPTKEKLELCAGGCFEDEIGNKACVSGTYNFRFQAISGCDSVVTMELLIPDTIRSEVWDTFCKGGVYQVGIFAVSQPGRYREKYINGRGCDSIIHYNLLHVDCEINSFQDSDTVICGGNTGQFSFMLTKGQGPFMYKWASEDEQFSGQGIIELEEEVVEPNLPGGIYAVTVTDRFDEEAILEIEIIRPDIISSQFLMPEYRGVNFACAADEDAFLELIPSGGVPPFSYEWSTGSKRRRIDNLPSGAYSVTVTDHYNCPHIARQTLKEPAQLVMLATANDPICEDINTGRIAVDAISGGIPPYQYRLMGSGYEDIGEFSDLGAGDYQLLVRDANNCLTDSTLSIVAPDIIEVFYEDEVTIELGDQVPLEIFPSHPVATVEWVGPEGLSCYDCIDPIVQPLESSSYAVTITSEDDCTTTATLNVRVAKERDVYIPNVFSPNIDGINDRFTIYGGPEVATVNYFRVFSRWGELLFEKNNFDPNDPQLGWDGQFNGRQVGQGVYIWIAQLTFIDNVVEEYSGDVLVSK